MTAAPKHEKGVSSGRARLLATAVVAVALVLLVAYAFLGVRPLSSARTLRLNVAHAYQLKPGDPVRVAGTRVGRVAGVDAAPGGTAVVELAVEDDDLMIHRDARFTIQTRLFVEGSFYIDVQPGSPAAPAIDLSATVAADRTTGPVQLDQVISMLTQPTRESLRSTVHELDIALRRDAPAAQPVPLRRAVDQLRRALPPATVTVKALRGRRPGDLGRTLRGTADAVSQLARDRGALARLVTNTRRTADALAADDRALAGGLRELAAVLRSAPGELPAIDGALVRARRFAAAVDPALVALPLSEPAITALLRELRVLSGPRLLPRTLSLARPVLAALPELGLRLRELTGELQPALDCVQTRVLPVLEDTVPDGKHSTGKPMWQEIMYLTASLAGGSPSFDGNGTTFRLGPTGSASALNGTIPGIGEVAGMASGAPEGIRPAAPWAAAPPFRPDARCTDQAVADLGAGLKSPATLRSVAASRDAGPLAPDALRELLERLARSPRDPRGTRPADKRPGLKLPSLTQPGQPPVTTPPPQGRLPRPVQPAIDGVGKGVEVLLDYLLGSPGKDGGR